MRRDRRQRERRQNDYVPPLDRREPWFTRGPEWRVWARKKAAWWILWGFDHGFISQQCMATLIDWWRPRHEKNH